VNPLSERSDQLLVELRQRSDELKRHSDELRQSSDQLKHTTQKCVRIGAASATILASRARSPRNAKDRGWRARRPAIEGPEGDRVGAPSATDCSAPGRI
jgi:hypothetical protein